MPADTSTHANPAGIMGDQGEFGTLLWSLPHKHDSKEVVQAAGSPEDTVHIAFYVNGTPQREYHLDGIP